MENDEAISKLLRLKRYEVPPVGYHENFLREFHRRQRSAMLKASPWQNLWESLTDIWPNFQVPKLAYAAFAAVAIGVGGLMISQPVPADPSRTSLAGLNRVPDFSLSPKSPVTIGNTLPVSSRADSRHYVLQPSPARNDQPLSF
jgi:hypothetical protein